MGFVYGLVCCLGSLVLRVITIVGWLFGWMVCLLLWVLFVVIWFGSLDCGLCGLGVGFDVLSSVLI